MPLPLTRRRHAFSPLFPRTRSEIAAGSLSTVAGRIAPAAQRGRGGYVARRRRMIKPRAASRSRQTCVTAPSRSPASAQLHPPGGVSTGVAPPVHHRSLPRWRGAPSSASPPAPAPRRAMRIRHRAMQPRAANSKVGSFVTRPIIPANHGSDLTRVQSCGNVPIEYWASAWMPYETTSTPKAWATETKSQLLGTVW